MDSHLIAALGGLVTVGLTVNAFFLRGIFLDLNQVRIELAKIVERDKSKDKRLDHLENNEREIFERLNILEREVLK